MRNFTRNCALLFFVASSCSVLAATISFTTNPLPASGVLATPGRQVVAGEPSLTFNIATDVLAIDPTVFGVSGPVSFANGLASSLPVSGLNVIVLESFDDDSNAATPFGAGNAATLIATQITTPGAGFFIYFNQGLNLPRLVYSTDLNDATADLAILARFTNLSGGQAQLASITASNFSFVTAAVPEPATTIPLLLVSGIVIRYLRHKR